MDPHLASYASLLLFVGAAASLFAFGHARRQQGVAPAQIPVEKAGKMVPLLDAAKAIYAEAKREGMVIVTVAEKADGLDNASAWFAQSIASVIPVYRVSASGMFERLEGGKSSGPELQSLYIRKRDQQTYLRWARSVQ